jgi:membrane protease YdiL (CAAX protease family)
VEMQRDSLRIDCQPGQIRKVIVILVLFVTLRLVAARIWERLFGGEYQLSIAFAAFVFGVFLVMSVLLIYLGFTRWVGVDLKAWWFRRGRIWGDLAWGVGTLLVFLLIVCGGLLIPAFLGVEPPSWVAGQPVHFPTLDHLAGMVVFGPFFGFAIAAFQEETLFRGFIQGALVGKVGRWPANFIQAALFSAAHLGLEPLEPIGQLAFIFVFRFLSGLVFGWLRDRRGSLLAPGVFHGLIG